VRQSLDKQLGQFLRQQRGNMTFAEFSRKVGLPASTLHRLEQGNQSITLRKLQHLLARLKQRLPNAFPIVMLSLEDYESLNETAYLLKSRVNARRLLAATKQLDSGKGKSRKVDLDA